MKVGIVLHRRFVYVGHFLAVHLKERHGIKDFCAYVYRRQGYEFLKNQKDIEYSTLLLDEDLHERYKTEPLDLNYIKYLERAYGIPNLWPYIEVDRIIRFNQLIREFPYNQPRYTHEEMMRIIQVLAREIIQMLEREKPDVILFSIIGAIGNTLLYHIAKKMGIKTYFISTARVGTRYVLSEDYANFTGVEKKFDAWQAAQGKSPRFSEALQIIEAFRQRPEAYDKTLPFYLKRTDRLKHMDFLLPRKMKNYAVWAWRVTQNYFFHDDKKDYSFIHPWGKLKDQIKRKIRNGIGVKDLYDTVDLNEDYAYFPLHLEPEITTLLYAPFYTDQLHLAKQIAKSLPLHFKLYVKEQPAMVEYRPRSFYKELKKIPNVKLIDPKVSSFDLIKHTKLITTITGTSGWEGLFFKKPVITFGQVFYNKLSMVRRCGDITQLPYLVKDRLERFIYNQDELVQFLACILEDSVDVDLAKLWEREPDMQKKKEGILPMADFIAAQLLKH